MSKRDPFNISLLRNDKSRLLGLFPVQSMDIFNQAGEFHPQGLFSMEVFGALGTAERLRKHGYIDMRVTIMHPKVFIELSRLKGLYAGIMSGKTYAIWDNALKDFIKADVISGKTGYGFFMEHFEQIKFPQNDSSIRDLRIDFITKAQKIAMYRYLIVLPAGLRDISYDDNNNVTEDEINNFYRKVLRISNTILVDTNTANDYSLNTIRWNLQKTFNDIYLYIESILAGKRGFILSKVARRAIHGGSRNVATSIDPAPAILGDPDANGINHTVMGLHQYLKSTTELTIHGIRNGPMKEIIENIPNNIPVINPKTLQRIMISPDARLVERWGSNAGIEKSINKFEAISDRHKPILIDNNYVALIYRDDQYFKVFYDIRDLPSEFNKDKVTPLTWAEMFYISVYKQINNTVVDITRYPIAELGSIYPSLIALKTTVNQQKLIPLDENWKPALNEPKALVMPVTGQPFYDSISVHQSKAPELGLDFDGDKINSVCLVSDEAVKETKDYLNSKVAFQTTSGDLRFGVNSPIIELIIHNLTQGLQPKHDINVRLAIKKDFDETLTVLTNVMRESKPNEIIHRAFYEEPLEKALQGNRCLILTRSKAIIGFCYISLKDKSKTGTLSLGVLQKYNGLGYGQLLVKKGIKLARELGFDYLDLSVDKDNKSAIAIYNKNGFKLSQTIHKDPDKQIMILKIYE